jgi:hypothetical protein
MSYTYATWVTALATELVINPTDANFLAILPSSIDYSEQRLYRELDFLNTVVRDSSSTLTVGTRNFTLPTTLGRFVVTNGINVVTPSTITNPDVGTRNQLVPVSRDLLDMIWPSTTGAGVPTQYAMITDQQIIVGPSPDLTYTIEVVGTIRPTPLNATNNTSTYLTTYLPDLWFAATMVFMTGYQQNWGAQSDNSGMAVSWNSQYDKLIASVSVEEQRKRYAAGAWSSMSPTPLATPSR